MQLQMLCQGFSREAKIKKMSFELKMAKSFIFAEFIDQCQLNKARSFILLLITLVPSFY